MAGNDLDYGVTPAEMRLILIAAGNTLDHEDATVALFPSATDRIIVENAYQELKAYAYAKN
jgi:hypothetical protein